MTETSSRKPRSAWDWSLRLKHVGGAGMLGLCALLDQPPAHAQTDAEHAQLTQVHPFTIPRQDLAIALITFGQQSGLQVSVDPDLLEGLESTAVSGNFSSEAALSRLLQSSGITWEFEAGTFIFRLLHSDGQGPLELHNTVVLGQTEENSYMGATVIGSKAIKAFPGANGDITTLLQMHPSVQFSTRQQNSNTPGEIAPADISINGAKYYQNNFMIDGISINNDLDPGAHDFNDVRQFDSTPSRSHGIALDADLLQEVKVYDSNVPAEYGGFNGGVVDAITRRPSKAFHGKVSYALSRSAWTRYHITEADQENFDQASDEQYQPEFEKTTVRGMLEGHLTDDFGAILAFSQKRSVLPLNAYSDGYESGNGPSRKDQTRELTNYMLKTYWNMNDQLTLDSSFIYGPGENTYFRANQRNSEFVTEEGGYQGSVKATWLADNATWTHTLAVTRLTSSRDSEQDDYINWYYSDVKNWGKSLSNTSRSAEGAYGDLDQTQDGLDYAVKAQWLPVWFGGVAHSLVTGIDLSYKRATWERSTQASSVTMNKRDDGSSCGDDPYCSVGQLLNGNTRQWANSRMVYEAGKISQDEKKYAFYLQDSIQLGNLGLRPGVRVEGDDYMEKKTVAPRFAGDYDFFGDRSTVLTFGANRYYGRNLFKTRLNDGRGQLNVRYLRADQDSPWIEATRVANDTRFSTLNIPYDDELTLGLEQLWLNTLFDLKYVNRKGRDKIVRSYSSVEDLPALPGYRSNYYIYTNQGRSESDTVTLTVTPQQELKLFGTSTSAQFAAGWQRSEDSYTDYDSILDSEEYDGSAVLYDGKRMDFVELPPNNFNRPWTARLTTITEIPAWHMSISNFLRFRSKYKQIIDTGRTVDLDNETLSVYEAAAVGSAMTWDMQVYWELPTAKDQAVFASVDITNVADKTNPTVSAGSQAVTRYEVGRQYWLEVGYRF
ncbi:TonB-dependent receptor [Pseudomonas putida]|uniref:TonB-dependent receptor n=1 Tax=Pseudomonas putida TaxID=303 RepID=UPI00226EA05E|nr:TonB-dependent receptor [Pseudomonas putida]WAB97807.1 TonB-dependent receptor [Pseudomonas putida]